MNFRARKEGFTLLELMLSLGILSVGILGVMSLMFDNIRVSQSLEEKAIATSLAQGGLEFAFNVREANNVKQIAYNNGLTSCSVGSPCCLDLTNKELTDSDCDAKHTLYWDSASLTYTHKQTGSLKKTIFTRKIIIEDKASFHYLDISSIVSWKGKEIKAVTHLYDWR